MAAGRIPREVWPILRRKLDQIDAVTRLHDLKVPPRNQLNALGLSSEVATRRLDSISPLPAGCHSDLRLIFMSFRALQAQG
jgi:hypothetical protein